MFSVGAIVALIGAFLYTTQVRPYAIMKDYIATRASEVKFSSGPEKVVSRCVKNVDCKAIRYTFDEENCSKASKAYLDIYCGTTKTVEFKGHTLLVSIGRNEDGSGHEMEVALAR